MSKCKIRHSQDARHLVGQEPQNPFSFSPAKVSQASQTEAVPHERPSFEFIDETSNSPAQILSWSAGRPCVLGQGSRE